MLQSVENQELTLQIIAVLLPLIAIALSWWSFRFAERGATPDAWPGGSDDVGFCIDEEALDRGERSRARKSAKASFAAGALCLAASVPIGAADSHRMGMQSPYAFVGWLILALCVAYGFKEARGMWIDRRENALNSMYARSSMISTLYPNEKAVRALFFRKNSLPWWNLPSRHWREHLVYLTADEMMATNQSA